MYTDLTLISKRENCAIFRLTKQWTPNHQRFFFPSTIRLSFFTANTSIFKRISVLNYHSPAKIHVKLRNSMQHKDFPYPFVTMLSSVTQMCFLLVMWKKLNSASCSSNRINDWILTAGLLLMTAKKFSDLSSAVLCFENKSFVPKHC